MRTIPVRFDCTAVDECSDNNDNYNETRQTDVDYNYDSVNYDSAVFCSFD